MTPVTRRYVATKTPQGLKRPGALPLIYKSYAWYRPHSSRLVLMTQAGTHEAKTKLCQLMERAEAGENVVIAHSGKPAARLVPVRSASALASVRGLGAAVFVWPTTLTSCLMTSPMSWAQGGCCWTRTPRRGGWLTVDG
jgi:prevent-host-death family protein